MGGIGYNSFLSVKPHTSQEASITRRMNYVLASGDYQAQCRCPPLSPGTHDPLCAAVSRGRGTRRGISLHSSRGGRGSDVLFFLHCLVACARPAADLSRHAVLYRTQFRELSQNSSLRFPRWTPFLACSAWSKGSSRHKPSAPAMVLFPLMPYPSTCLSERAGHQRNGYTTVPSIIGHHLVRSLTMASIPIQNETDYTLTDDM